MLRKLFFRFAPKLYCKNEADWSGSTMRIAYSGIKFFYTRTLPMDWETIQLLP